MLSLSCFVFSNVGGGVGCCSMSSKALPQVDEGFPKNAELPLLIGELNSNESLTN